MPFGKFNLCQPCCQPTICNWVTISGVNSLQVHIGGGYLNGIYNLTKDNNNSFSTYLSLFSSVSSIRVDIYDSSDCRNFNYQITILIGDLRGPLFPCQTISVSTGTIIYDTLDPGNLCSAYSGDITYNYTCYSINCESIGCGFLSSNIVFCGVV